MPGLRLSNIHEHIKQHLLRTFSAGAADGMLGQQSISGIQRPHRDPTHGNYKTVYPSRPGDDIRTDGAPCAGVEDLQRAGHASVYLRQWLPQPHVQLLPCS